MIEYLEIRKRLRRVFWLGFIGGVVVFCISIFTPIITEQRMANPEELRQGVLGFSSVWSILGMIALMFILYPPEEEMKKV